MAVNVQALISSLNAKIESAPDFASQAVQAMSTTAQTNIKATLYSGAPLHVRTGNLADSVRETYFSPGAVAEAHVAPTIVYSRIQELSGISGKDYHSHLPPRPYVAPTVEESMDEFRQDAIDTMNDMWGD
jgi:phage gpG-like protein